MGEVVEEVHEMTAWTPPTWAEAIAAAGLPAYEVSNHAAPGAESRHNLTYWRYQDYAGIGPDAHGRRRRGLDALVITSAVHAELVFKQVRPDKIFYKPGETIKLQSKMR